jgi:tetraacyldisaccharide 4'-kinase
MQLLRKIAFPLSMVYGSVVYLRNLCFDLGIFSSRSFATPSVCIGNLSTGGTGKTPMIEWILKHLGSGRKLAVLSRGYKRRSRGFLIIEPQLDPSESGDEPLQIARKFPLATVAVDANRRRGIKTLEERVSPDLILLDDAFQHRKVTPRFNILLTAYSELYVRDWYLPTGNLRDHKTQAKRAQVIVVTKCPPDMGEDLMATVTKELHPLPHQKVFFSTLAYGDEVKGSRGGLGIQELKDREVLLVTAIADPGPLLEHLNLMGIRFTHRNFPDHHYFSRDEIRVFNQAELVLTTEKDFTRMGEEVPKAYYLPVEHRFLGQGKERLLALLTDL